MRSRENLYIRSGESRTPIPIGSENCPTCLGISVQHPPESLSNLLWNRCATNSGFSTLIDRGFDITEPEAQRADALDAHSSRQ
jgi:hypothetical protein